MSTVTVTYRTLGGLSQVVELVDAYWERRAQLEREGRGTYHHLFHDLPGIAGLENADTPVYLLSQLWSLVKLHDEQTELVEQGWTRITEMQPNETRRCKQLVMFYCEYVGEGSYSRHEWVEARLLADAEGRPYCLLPKGKRTNGVAAGGRRALYVAP